MGFWDILLNENIYISALSSLENPGRYSHHQTSSPKPSLGTNPEPPGSSSFTKHGGGIKPQTLGQKPLQTTLKSPSEDRVALQCSWEGATTL